MGCRLWGRTESDTTEVTWRRQQQHAGSSLLRGLFSSEQGLLSSCGALVSHCSAFSCCRAQALGRAGFSSCGVWAQ